MSGKILYVVSISAVRLSCLQSVLIAFFTNGSVIDFFHAWGNLSLFQM